MSFQGMGLPWEEAFPWSFEQTRISLGGGPSPVASSLPRGLLVTGGEGPVHGKLSAGAVISSRDMGAHREGLFSEPSVLSQ